MKKFKDIIFSILFPPVLIIVLSTLIGFPAVIISLVFLSKTNPISYVSYVLSAYALTILCTNFTRAKRHFSELIHGDELKAIVSFRRFMNHYKYTSMYLNEREFRARISLYSGLAINMFYAVFKCATGAMFHSAWLWANGIYYVILGAIRFALLKNIHITDKKEHPPERKIHEYKSARLCGIMMFLLNIAMTGMTVQMIWQNRGYKYNGYVIYISAMYAFYCFINAVVSVIKFAKVNNPILSSAKILSLASALMSMFTLQTAMFSAFDTSGAAYQRMMNTITGGFVCTIVMAMAFFMIVWSNKNLKSLERSIKNEKQ